MDNSTTGITRSHLGLTLEQYIVAYRNTFLEPPNWFLDLQYEKVQADIKTVSEFGRDGLYDTPNLSISTLRSIMHYSYSPTGYQDLGSPELISGCIRIMSSITMAGKEPFLSYEMGYICLHIVAIGLGACLFRRGQTQGVEINDASFEIPVMYKASHITSQMVAELAAHLGGQQRDTYNCILGWSACPEHQRSQLVVSVAEAGTLLHLLYRARHQFLRILQSTYLVGPSAVTFVLWRYVTYQRSMKNQQEVQGYFALLHDIFWRCWLVATPREQSSFESMYSWDSDLWPKLHDAPASTDKLQNSQVLIGAFIEHSAPAAGGARRIILPVSLSNLMNVLSYVTNYFQPGCEDLIAGYIHVTVEKMWYILSDKTKTDPLFGRALGTSVFPAFCIILQLLRDPRWTNTAIALRVINATVEADLLDLIARTIFLLVPHAHIDRNSQIYRTNAHVLSGSTALYGQLTKLLPAQVMRKQFELYGSDWWKVTRHLGLLRQVALPGEHATSEVRSFFYALCLDSWGKVGKAICHTETELSARFCHYARCPDPWVVVGVVHSCSNCSKVEYCSLRCQGMDWMHDHERRSHRALCTRYEEIN
ncbi:hypothetical protein RSOL_464690 [Rhizoctonia solani AG-3 Rhs1AP]|uniref:MYND-type domain-containing protein n=2 Tax=Rhizoctonia solani AG-3 TaxID=1086053 RepID=A0A074RTV9_9AGAM|nr:hypothetical protein RSOL_464690 [Rhizoctonia solani AG-3 Rhs1AP]KEP48098.1 hypothetical protein V565_133860 [Rhizoctonia solani 123E]